MSTYQCKQIWDGQIKLTDDRKENKMSADDFEQIFTASSLIEKHEMQGLGAGMFLLDVKYKHTDAIVHLIYQDLRSGDKDNDGRKRFQVSHVQMNTNEQYFYIGGYNTNDKKLFFAVLTGTREYNEGASASSLWLMFEPIYETYQNGVKVWKSPCYKTSDLTILGCDADHLSFMHNALMSRSLDNYIPQYIPAENIESVEQKIFYGAPGGGKSHKAKEYTANSIVYRTTFHPDTDYSSFVGAYKPVPKVVDDKEIISYEFIAQTFLEAYIDAWEKYAAFSAEVQGNPDAKPQKVSLLIEELNRGNCAQIFGDLFQLLDRTKKGFSEYSIIADADLAKYLKDHLSDIKFYYDTIYANSDKTENGESIIPMWNAEESKNKLRLCLPPNLSIICTMNTSDQSLFPMDSAFKRRWDWQYVPIEYSNEKSGFFVTIDSSHKYSWPKFLKQINDKIEYYTHSEDKQMGNFFVKGDENLEVDSEQFVSKVMFYLWSEICKDNPRAKSDIFLCEYEKDGQAQREDFTFTKLFDKDKRNYYLIGFMNHLKVESEYAEGSEDSSDPGIIESTYQYLSSLKGKIEEKFPSEFNFYGPYKDANNYTTMDLKKDGQNGKGFIDIVKNKAILKCSWYGLDAAKDYVKSIYDRKKQEIENIFSGENLDTKDNASSFIIQVTKEVSEDVDENLTWHLSMIEKFNTEFVKLLD